MDTLKLQTRLSVTVRDDLRVWCNKSTLNASGANKKPRLPELELKLNIEAVPTDEFVNT